MVVFGRHDEGANAKVSHSFGDPDASDTLHIDAHVGLGQVIVEREVG